MKNIIVGMGEALWDLLPEGKKIGGAPANFAYHISQFGFESYVVSSIGDDQDGDEILNNFDSKHLRYIIEKVKYPTGTVAVNLDKNGIPCYEINQNVAWDNIPYTEKLHKLALSTKAVCFGSLAQRNIVSRETINRFLDSMPEDNDTLKIFDINLRQNFYDKEILTESFRRCNVLKINDEELEIVSEMFGISHLNMITQSETLIRMFHLKMLILTCGTCGSYIFSGSEYSFLETPKVKVADTVGAGDSFTGAFCAAILNGMSMNEAHRIAVETSAFVCTCHGAMPLLPVKIREKMALKSIETV